MANSLCLRSDLLANAARRIPARLNPPRKDGRSSSSAITKGRHPQPRWLMSTAFVLKPHSVVKGRSQSSTRDPRDAVFACVYPVGTPKPLPPRARRNRRATVGGQTHTRPGTRSQCDSWLSSRGLGHRYLTDVLEVNLPGMTSAQSRSVLYALLTGTPAVGVPTGDVRGTLRPGGASKPPALIIFDSVPGGAGHVRRIAKPDSLRILLEAARSTVAECGCATDTSCYGCLRSYYNQAHHDQLVRSDALSVLNGILGVPLPTR